MEYRITSSPLLKNISIKLPASKSISNRALIINALAKNIQPINNLSDCDDTDVMQAALHNESEVLNIGAAGTAMRFLTAYLSITPGEWTLTGSERMKQRPIKILVNALRSIGASIDYKEKEGYPPLHIKGKHLEGGGISLEGGISSQYISALLMIAPSLTNGLKLEISGNLISTPYVRLTLKLMKDFGVNAVWENNTISIPPQNYHTIPFCVEADWSAASYWYEMAALDENSQIGLQGLFTNSYQGDSKVAVLFKQLGVSTRFTEDGIIITGGGKKTERFEYDFINEPDLVQTFAVTCSMLDIPFHFKGVQSLKIKETDRIEALRKELKKLGILLEESDGTSLIWTGKRSEPISNPVIDTYEDHRMAMSFMPVALINKQITIRNPHVVSKSYPSFWKDLRSSGFAIQEIA